MANVTQHRVVRDCKDAREFLTEISPFGGQFWQTHERGRWVFRGHKKASWECLPSARRPEGIAKLRAALGESDNVEHTFAFQELIEARAVLHFAANADAFGFSIPDDSIGRRRKLASRVKSLDKITREPLSLTPNMQDSLYADGLLAQVALAQHYGVPTALLDWTLSPFAAAFFASDGNEDSEYISVVALSREAVERMSSDACWQRHDGITFIYVPKSGNENLRVQHGIFSIARVFGNPLDPFKSYSIESLLDELVEVCRSGGSQVPDDLFPCMVTTRLPLSEVPSLRRYLKTLGYSRPVVYPSLREAAEQALRPHSDS